jgi:hypothetical protein
VFPIKDEWSMMKLDDEEKCQKRAHRTTIEFQPFDKYIDPSEHCLTVIDIFINEGQTID